MARALLCRRFPESLLDALVAASVEPLAGGQPFRSAEQAQSVVDVLAVGSIDAEVMHLGPTSVEEPGDDETAGIEDVDLGEEPAAAAGEEETFLVEEEEGGDTVTGLIEGGAPGGKEDEEEA